jgi:mannose-1-phosphate guanylyltransferase
MMNNDILVQRRPWGFWVVLEKGQGFKVKKLTVMPGKKLSLQNHKYRNEHWLVVDGTASVRYMFPDLDVKFKLSKNESFYIQKGVKHQLLNETDKPLNVIEVQTGRILSEDDIKRFAE